MSILTAPANKGNLGSAWSIDRVRRDNLCSRRMSAPESGAIFVPGFRVPAMAGGRGYKQLRLSNNSASSLNWLSTSRRQRGRDKLLCRRSETPVKEAFMAQAIALSISDLNTTVNHEPRVSHRRLAKVLAYGQPHKLGHLIERNLEELQRYGEVSSTMDGTTRLGGRPGKIWWLNEPQALLVIIRSDAPKAPDARQEVITVFMAYRRGLLEPKLTTVKEHTRRISPPKPEIEPRGPATGLPYGRYLITVDLDGCIVPIETETVARGTHIMDTDKLYYLQKAIMQIIPRQCGRAA